MKCPDIKENKIGRISELLRNNDQTFFLQDSFSFFKEQNPFFMI